MDHPKRREDVETRTVDDEVILFDVAANRIHRLNRSASFIWQWCDGRQSASDIAALLGTAYAVPADGLMDDVQTTLAEFDRLGLLVNDPER